MDVIGNTPPLAYHQLRKVCGLTLGAITKILTVKYSPPKGVIAEGLPMLSECSVQLRLLQCNQMQVFLLVEDPL